MAEKPQTATVDGHRIRLTNLDKVLYPETGTTKADVLAYYAAVAHVLIPHAADRPATRKRWVHGVGTADEPGQVFFQKNLDESTPSWVKRGTLEHKNHASEYPLVNDLATLTWLAQIAALEIHVPQWQFGRTGKKKNPDRLVLDLDPGEGATLADCAEVAKLARSILQDMGLEPLPVTSGSKGIHLYAALDGKQTSDQISDVAHELARALETDHPDLIVSDMKKSLRQGKVLVDWSQNNAAKTTVAPYSLRGRLHPTVAVPRTWRELASKDLAQLEYSEVVELLKKRNDPLAAVTAGRLSVLEPTTEHMATFETSPSGKDRLQKYRSMRDAKKTPEPVPEEAAATTTGQSFVIQEHHARRLHYDFRLERDGVLVSWALPKGVPTDPKKNHLAVQTEDHPLEYGTFEGRIPEGEYGAGEVTIWDSGEYELEKWREGEEVIVVLHGEDGGGLGGPRKVALIHTGQGRGGQGQGGQGKQGKSEQNWLIHLMKDSPGTSTRSKRDSSPQESKQAEAAKESKRSRSAKSSKDSTETETEAGTWARRHEVIAPMLATMGVEADLSEDDEWAIEMKWDGIRAVAYVGESAGDIRLLTRNGNDVTVTYPDLTEPLRAQLIDGTAVLDGEIVAINKNGAPDFGLLQTRMKLTKKGEVDRAVSKTPVQFMLFDILERDGHSLLSDSYDDRRRVLEDSVRPAGIIQLPPAFDSDVEHAIESSLELGLEGIVAKKRDSTYSAGRRSRAWIKIKHHLAQEVVIGGWRPGKGRRQDAVGSLLLGIPGDEGLRYVGRVGTGFGDRELEELASRLAKLRRKTSPFADVPRADAQDAKWITPKLVGEVEFAEWTSTGRLRQPSWRGWRPDKSADEVVPETR